MPLPADDVTLEPLSETDFGLVRALAGAIWRQHYPSIVTSAQIEYMLGGRFTDDALRQWTRRPNAWLEVLRVDGTAVGYCGSESAGLPWDEAASAMKLTQLYLLESHRGRGLGCAMLRHVEQRARGLAKGVLFLQVNKKNEAAIAFYLANGFGVAREAVFDIGAGFVMDDFIMVKPLSRVDT